MTTCTRGERATIKFDILYVHMIDRIIRPPPPAPSHTQAPMARPAPSSGRASRTCRRARSTTTSRGATSLPPRGPPCAKAPRPHHRFRCRGHAGTHRREPAQAPGQAGGDNSGGGVAFRGRTENRVPGVESCTCNLNPPAFPQVAKPGGAATEAAILGALNASGVKVNQGESGRIPDTNLRGDSVGSSLQWTGLASL